jgi:hypothetical protein
MPPYVDDLFTRDIDFTPNHIEFSLRLHTGTIKAPDYTETESSDEQAQTGSPAASRLHQVSQQALSPGYDGASPETGNHRMRRPFVTEN